MRRSLEHHGFEWREFTIAHLIQHLKDREDKELLAYFDEGAHTPVTAQTLPPMATKTMTHIAGMKISDKLYVLFASDNLGHTFTGKQIIDMVIGAFPGTNRSSVIPSDYCYNIVNAGIKFDRHLLKYIEDSMYRVLGKDLPLRRPYFMERQKRWVSGKRVRWAPPFMKKLQNEIRLTPNQRINPTSNHGASDLSSERFQLFYTPLGYQTDCPHLKFGGIVLFLFGHGSPPKSWFILSRFSWCPQL